MVLSMPSIPSMPSLSSMPFMVQTQGNTNLPPPPPRPPSGHHIKPTINGPFLNPAPKSEAIKPAQHSLGIPDMGGSSGSSSSSYSVTCILFSGIIFVAAIFIGIAALVNSVHRVQEGNIAVYFKNGALMPEIGGPGIHLSTPFVTTILQRPGT